MNAALPRMAAMLAFASWPAMPAIAQAPPQVNAGGATDSPAAWHEAGPDDPWSAVEPEFAEGAGRVLARRSSQRESPVLAGKAESPKYPWARTLGALAGVVGLIVFLAWGYRAMAGGHLALLGRARRAGLIEVITKTPLSARQSLCLVRVGPRLLLVGQSPEGLRALDVIDDASLAAKLVGEATGRRSDSSRAEFHECLEREARDYQNPDEDIDETIGPDAQRVAGVRRGVADAVRRIRRAVARV